MNGKTEIIPVFFSVDDRFVPYLYVTMTSLIKNASSRYTYHLHILYTELKEENKQTIYELTARNVEIFFDDCSDYLRAISEDLPIRDYYSKTTYFRLFIAEMYPDYDKVIYLDSDIIVLGDISDLYHHDIKDDILGACVDTVMELKETGLYSEKCLGISPYHYFNAGVLLINTDQFRKMEILDRFVRLLSLYEFVVAQDQDYLNVICKDRVTYLKSIWDIETCMPIKFTPDQYRIIHYNMANKPWHYPDCPAGEYFWKYAKLTPYYDFLQEKLASYTDEERLKDSKVIPSILSMCLEEVNRPDNFLRRLDKTRNPKRVAILEHISELERVGKFDIDCEDDPPTRMLKPGEVDYLRRRPSSKIKAKFAFSIASLFVKKMVKKKQLVIKGFEGLENLAGLKSGAVITCNHFSPLDSFAIQLAYEELHSKKGRFHKRKLYRVIREGNYTNFPGFYGFLMRNCDTLPLSSNLKVLKEFIVSTDYLLQEGNFVLFYPEQSLWWNYRKPKPLKKGAFSFASNNRVPVIPVFMTMKDTFEMDHDGYPVQEITVHFGKIIYPDPDYSPYENAEIMMKENERIWKEIYEKTYQMPLIYNTDKEELEREETLKRAQS